MFGCGEMGKVRARSVCVPKKMRDACGYCVLGEEDESLQGSRCEEMRSFFGFYERQKDNSMVLALCCPGLNHITNWLCYVDKSKL
ncbi:hypothetical protein COLO4_22688 [Corchorus olitorius]|uniref:Uncharacterized protein n=1 Tax=Corchorus olitorius TaxID=93759 RepID=A0A1R3IKP4_9ROSI|nr:hypothetical protein COLO4_22688 [Corchorus olitorius]